MGMRGIASYVYFSAYDLVEMLNGACFEEVVSNQFELIQPVHDHWIKQTCFCMGADKRDMDIQACVHRRLNGEVVVGYRYIFREREDKEWLSKRASNIEAHIAAQSDSALKGDMIQASSEGVGEAGWNAMVLNSISTSKIENSRSKDLLMEDYQENAQLIKALQHAQKDIRGYLNKDEII